MDRPLNMPRRAWQRRNLRRAAGSNSSTEQPAHHAGTAPARKRQSSFGQERDEEADFSVGSTSDSEPEEEYGQRRRPAPRTTPAAQPRRQRRSDALSDHTRSGSESNSDSESDDDSGYCSLDEDADERAEYYDDMLERFRKEGPTLANHGENTKRMETDQEAIWNK